MAAASPLDAALRAFEAAEANLAKLEKVWREIEKLTPNGLEFGAEPEYERRCRDFIAIVRHLPVIDGWKIAHEPLDRDDIGQMRFDAKEVGEIDAIVSVERAIEAPGRDIAEYRFRFDQKRRELVRSVVLGLVEQVDEKLRILEPLTNEDDPATGAVAAPEFEEIRDAIAQVDTLLGSTVKRPARWSDLQRHLRFGQVHDLHDIIHLDWPAIKPAISHSLYGEREPISVGVEDLGEIVASKPRGRIITKLKWGALTAEDFERLIFVLISTADGYENPEWLMKTTAADRGRDLSVARVVSDSLSGVSRKRVIIQSKHWLERSVSVPDVAALKEQIRLWEPPKVDTLVIATSGRFSMDAVQAIERHNDSDTGLRIEMWPESHLERLLAARPALIAEFRLK